MHFTCPKTSKSFIAEPIREQRENEGNFYWVYCGWCDSDGHVRGESGYDRHRPQVHPLEQDHEKEHGAT